MFAAYGNIKSLVLQKNEIGQFGFVCYDDKEGKDKEYGPKCAGEAIAALHGKDMPNNLKLYVRAAMKKQDRESEKMKETLRYKTSKKRCNLYVKNFPTDYGEAELKQLFDQFGPIEKIRVEKKGKAGNAFAFVCFKTPDAAASAKQALHNHCIGDKSLMINHYEIKQLRDLQIEEAIDKSDFEKYQA
jgi:RNA recognition motif-containing protein